MDVAVGNRIVVKCLGDQIVRTSIIKVMMKETFTCCCSVYKVGTGCTNDLPWYSIVAYGHGRKFAVVILMVLSGVQIQCSFLNPFADPIVLVGLASQTKEPNVIDIGGANAHSSMRMIHNRLSVQGHARASFIWAFQAVHFVFWDYYPIHFIRKGQQCCRLGHSRRFWVDVIAMIMCAV